MKQNLIKVNMLGNSSFVRGENHGNGGNYETESDKS